MKALIKRYGWIVLLLLVCGGVLGIGYNFLQDLFFERGMAAAKGFYEQKIADADAAAVQARNEKTELAEKAGRDQDALRQNAEREIRKINNVFAVFKSKSTEELKGKNATIAEVLAEKEKDEIALVEAKETITFLEHTNIETLAKWAASDIAISAAHKKEIDAINLKYTSCREWSDKLEKKLKRPKVWTYLFDAAKIGGAFLLGRVSK